MSDCMKEITLASERIYDGRILNLRRDKVQLSDGTESAREVVEHSGGVGVLAVWEGKFVFVRQFRYPYGETVLEIPAGKLNRGENPMECGKRELSEETGLTSENLVDFGCIYPSPGYTNEKLYIYLALDLQKGEAHLDEGEFLNVEYYSEEEVKSMLKKGEIKDAKTVIALQKYFLRK